MKGEAQTKETRAQRYLRDYLAHLANERRLSPHTSKNYARDIAALIELAAETPLAKLQIH